MTTLLLALVFYYGQLQQKNYQKEVVRDYIVIEALTVGVNPQLAIKVVELESKFNPKAVGDGGNSYGMWQIHLPSHPDVTKEMALDPVWSTNWSLREIKQNSCKIWSTCQEAKRSINIQPGSNLSEIGASKLKGDT